LRKIRTGSDLIKMAATSGGKSRSKTSGYQYMTPSYVLDDQLHEAANYQAISCALLENSSAHGFPTLYRAQGELSLAVTTS